MTEVQRGARVRVLTAGKKWLEKRALGPVVAGKDFPVVWVCSESDWGNRSDGEPEGCPWPAEDVQLLDGEG